MTRSKSSGSRDSTLPTVAMPALAITTSMPPKRSTVPSTARFSASVSRTSASNQAAWAPMDSATAASRSGSSPTSETLQPLPFRRRADSAPIPRAAPVMSTTFPVRSHEEAMRRPYRRSLCPVPGVPYVPGVQMSFLALLERLEPQVTGRLRRMVGPDAAEDLRQELLLRAWRKAPRDLDEPGMRAWLHAVGSNLAIDELRRRKHRDHDELGDTHVAPTANPIDRIAAREALDRVSGDDRALLWLRFEAGLSHAELGSYLGTTPE